MRFTQSNASGDGVRLGGLLWPDIHQLVEVEKHGEKDCSDLVFFMDLKILRFSRDGKLGKKKSNFKQLYQWRHIGISFFLYLYGTYTLRDLHTIVLSHILVRRAEIYEPTLDILNGDI